MGSVRVLTPKTEQLDAHWTCGSGKRYSEQQDNSSYLITACPRCLLVKNETKQLFPGFGYICTDGSMQMT